INEAIKNYESVTITNVVKEYTKNELGLDDSVEYLRQRETNRQTSISWLAHIDGFDPQNK
ncbi:1102_t:CDS:2, partial [Scutellospora calospora]